MWSHLLVLACALLLLPAQALAGAKETVATLAPSGLVLVMDEQGNDLVVQNADKPFVPASVAKIVTAWLAMEVLGGDYRFETRFSLDGGCSIFAGAATLSDLRRAGSARVGTGRRNRQEAAKRHRARRELLPFRHPHPGHRGHRRGLRRAELRARGELQHDPCRAQGQDGPLRREADPDHATRDHPVPVAGPPGSRSHQPDPGPRSGPAICRRADRRIHRAGRRQREGSTGAVPEGLEPVYVHRQSRSLAEILAGLLLGSNNYIANQVFLEIGGHRLGGPVSLEKSLQVANEMLAKHGLAESIHLEEGSGISRGNRFTARGLAQLLHLFEPNATLLRRGDGARFKTGTFSGVRTLAGYADTSKHGRVRFVISLSSNDGAMRFQLLKAIQSEL
jgi:D-alanyl-D-alanine carboxypeptidase/D-alanyl-D-alanine-endopeptidase (penicillin-binding protein 4)